MLVADRFLSTALAAIDLATGLRVELRRLPAVSRAEQSAWDESCWARARGAGPAGLRLVDYGLLAHGERFEAWRACTRGDAERDNLERAGELRKQLEDLVATAALGEPRTLRLAAGAVQWGCLVVEGLARVARISGFVPVLANLAVAGEVGGISGLLASPEERAEVDEIVRSRHVLLIATDRTTCHHHAGCARRADRRRSLCPAMLGRLIVRIAATNARPTLLLLGPRPAPARCGEMSRPTTGTRVPQRMALALARAAPGLAATRAAEAHESYRVAPSDVASLRTRAANALEQVRGPRCQRAEFTLRGFAGALARRGDLPGAAWVTLSLGCLLLERGRALEAARAFDSARQQFDAGRSARGAIRATVYLGLAWTDDRRLAEASAALRCAVVACDEIRAEDLAAEARLGLARCLYWQGRFDEAATVLATIDDVRRTAGGGDSDGRYNQPAARAAVAREVNPVDGWATCFPVASLERRALLVADPDCGVRHAALGARVSLALGDARDAMRQANTALETAGVTGQAVDLAVAHTACALVHAAMGDTTALRAHAAQGIGHARRAHAPLRALRLRLLAADVLRHGARAADSRRALRRLATLRLDRFPGLLRARLALIAQQSGGSAERAAGRRDEEAAGFALAACPWRCQPHARDMAEDLVRVLETCHDSENEDEALARICEELRARVRAVSVTIVGRGDAAAATFAQVGCPPGAAPLIDRVLDTGMAVGPVATPHGKEAASPVRYAGTTIGVVFVRWPADAFVDARRVALLLSAAAAGAAAHLRSLLDRAHAPAGPCAMDAVELVGVSQGICTLRRAVRRAAGAPFAVLIEGESGSGKELVARAIHRESARRARRFCAVNCAALADDLLEAELFGHARGAFTGAVMERPGLFEEADGGTLFLDEVADLSARAQAKLLRAVQDGEIRRIGENLARSVDARVVAATNRSLQAEADAGTFRRDLFYRLHVVHVLVPPLRERPEDIPLLAVQFWQQATARTGSRATLAPPTLAALARYHWPGNVRELQNVMAALAVSAPLRGSVGPASLPAIIAAREAEGSTLEAAREAFERGFVRAALARAGGHRGRTAAALGMSRQGLAKVIARLGIEPG